MKLVIRGVRYPFEDLFNEPSVGQALRIVRATGLSLEEIRSRFGEMIQVGDDLKVKADPRLLEGFIALMWLARSAAGEDITFQEASEFKWSEWSVELDPDDVKAAEPENPTSARTDSVPGVDSEGPESKRTPSKRTSGKRSTRG